jgi:hypothetical protein
MAAHACLIHPTTYSHQMAECLRHKPFIGLVTILFYFSQHLHTKKTRVKPKKTRRNKMAKTLILEFPEPLFDLILKRATQIKQTPEQMVMTWIEQAAKPSDDDALLQLAGIFQSRLTDIGERHNEYIGEPLATNNE